MSDLHLERMVDDGYKFVKTLQPVPDSVLVLAGDIWSGTPSTQKATTARLSELCGMWSDIVYVAGNHEFYGTGIEAQLFFKELQSKYPSFVYLDGSEPRTVRSQRFIGDTMWFPKLSRCAKYESHFSDFKRIENLADWCYDHNARFRKLLETELLSSDVVLTHHLPSYGSISTRFMGSAQNIFYISNMEDIIVSKQPKLWVHGHTHDQFDYKLGETRIVANPRGYEFEFSQKNWDPAKVIEV